MNNNILSKLLDIMNELYCKQKSLQEVFESSDIGFLDSSINALENLILEEFGVPEDNTLEMIKKYGEFEAYGKEEFFCRDGFSDWFFEFFEGRLPKEKLIFNLLNWDKLPEKSD